MLSKTHLLAGLVVGLFAIDIFTIEKPIIFLLLFCFATILPDIDYPHSTIGKKVRPISDLFFLIFGHRGILHSIWIPLIILGVSYYLGYLFIGYSIMGGYILHLMVDTLTFSGIKWLGFGYRTHGFIQTGSITEVAIFLLLLAILFWKLLGYL